MNASGPSSHSITKELQETIRGLSDATAEAAALSVDEELIATSGILMAKLEATLDVHTDVLALQQRAPIKHQRDYVEYVHKLEASLERAKAVGLEKSHTQFAIDLIARCNAEYWLETMTERLRAVKIAKDCHEHDMNRLKQAVNKAQALRAAESMTDASSALYERLFIELGTTSVVVYYSFVRVAVLISLGLVCFLCSQGCIELCKPFRRSSYRWIHCLKGTGSQTTSVTSKRTRASLCPPQTLVPMSGFPVWLTRV